MRIVAIDPGTERSAWVECKTPECVPIDFGIADNRTILHATSHWRSLLRGRDNRS